jgi:hypothetical protein
LPLQALPYLSVETSFDVDSSVFRRCTEDS